MRWAIRGLIERGAFCGWFSVAAESMALGSSSVMGAGVSRPVLLGDVDVRPPVLVTVRGPGGGVSRPLTGALPADAEPLLLSLRLPLLLPLLLLPLVLLLVLPRPLLLSTAGDSRPPALGPPRAPWNDRKRCAMTGLIDRTGLPARRGSVAAGAGAVLVDVFSAAVVAEAEAAAAAVAAEGLADGCAGDCGGDLSSGRAADSRASRMAGNSCSFIFRIRATSSRNMSSCANSRFT
jgi:hypothetical protein